MTIKTGENQAFFIFFSPVIGKNIKIIFFISSIAEIEIIIRTKKEAFNLNYL